MNSLQLYGLACSSARSPRFRDVIFDSQDIELKKYDVLEREEGGFFRNHRTNGVLWPDSAADASGNDVDALFLATDNPKEVGNKRRTTFIEWSFGGPLDVYADELNIVVPDALLKTLPRKIQFDDAAGMAKWMKEEFLFPVEEGESLFFRIVGDAVDQGASWLGRRWIAEIVGKRTGGKDYLVVEKLRKAPRKALNLQRGRAKTLFTSEQDAIEANPAIKAQFDKAKSDSNSIINLWRTYNDTDAMLLEEQRERSGTLRIDKISVTENGKTINAFVQNNPESIEDFRETYEVLKEDYPAVISTQSLKRGIQIMNVAFDASRRTVSWKWAEDRPHESIANAEIKIDFRPWEIQIERRKNALENVRSRNIPIPAITDLLNKVDAPMFGGNAASGEHRGDADLRAAFGEDVPNEAQLCALKVCLGTPDIALVQGPPGTGKTSVIRALQKILQIPDKRRNAYVPSVLLTSYQHVAVDNVAEGSSIWGLPVFRFYGKEKDRGRLFKGLEDWQKETTDVLNRQIESLHNESDCDGYERLMRWLDCIRNATSNRDVRSFLDEAIHDGTAAHALAEGEVACLREWKRRFLGVSADDRLYKRLMAIRTTPVGYADDGRANLERLACFCEVERDSINCPPLEQGLERLRKIMEGAPREDDFAWLRKLRNDCVARIAPDSVENFNGTRLAGLKRYIDEELIPDIEERVSRSDIRLASVLKGFRTIVGFRSVRNAMLKYAATFAATTQQSVSRPFVNLLKKENFGFDYVIVDEAARANPLDLFIPIALAKKKVILVGDHRQLPQLVEQAILERMEGSGETEKLEKLKQSMEKSLFESLWNYLKNERTDGVKRTVTLNVQYRMPQKLGDFISESFYGGKDCISTGKRPEDCVHAVTRYRKSDGSCKCAVWEDVDGRESGKQSKKNEAEAQLIVKRLREIVPETDETIGVIASYSAQVELIKRLVEKTPELTVAVRDKRLEIGSVDAFQGRQFDIVFFSVVRNNERFNFGFLAMENRLNVAFSRQKKLLVVVGNKRMFSSDAAEKKVPALKAFVDLANSES